MTPIEVERLQGFEDGWTEKGINGLISDTQRYKCLGNAVTVPIVKLIGLKLIRELCKITEEGLLKIKQKKLF